MKQNKNCEPLLTIKPTQAEADLAEIRAIAATPIPVEVVSESHEVIVHNLRYNDPNRVIERAQDGGDAVVASLGAIPLSHMARTPEHIQREAEQQARFDAFKHDHM